MVEVALVVLDGESMGQLIDSCANEDVVIFFDGADGGATINAGEAVAFLSAAP